MVRKKRHFHGTARNPVACRVHVNATLQRSTSMDAFTIRRAQKGDRRALRDLVAGVQSSVHGLVHRMLVGRREDAEEATQDALVKVATQIRRFDPDGSASFKTWALKIALNTALDRRRALARAAQRSAALVDGYRPSEAASGPEDVARQQELRRRVLKVAESLPDEQRAVLVLRAFHDLDYPEIADVVGAPVGTVKSRLNRAQAALQSALAEGEST